MRKICVSGRQAVPVVGVVDSVGKRQLYQVIRLSVGRARCLEVFSHQGKRLVVAVVGVGAAV